MEIDKDEIIKWFWEKFNSCYLVKHDDLPECVFMFYDPQYIRKLKLAKISGEKINKTDVTGVCLFYQDWKNKLFHHDYWEIWKYLYSNYSDDYDKIQEFISDRLKEYPNLSVLVPAELYNPSLCWEDELPKFSMLTPTCLSLHVRTLVEGTFQNQV